MHYDHPDVKVRQRLTLVVYKHGTNFKPRKNKRGVLVPSCVDYEVASIRECTMFPPRLLRLILSNPYDYFNEALSDLPFENWYTIALTSEGDYDLGKINASDITDVTDRKDDDTLFLH